MLARSIENCYLAVKVTKSQAKKKKEKKKRFTVQSTANTTNRVTNVY